jgi:hypothetical protein
MTVGSNVTLEATASGAENFAPANATSTITISPNSLFWYNAPGASDPYNQQFAIGSTTSFGPNILVGTGTGTFNGTAASSVLTMGGVRHGIRDSNLAHRHQRRSIQLGEQFVYR